jgi:hypothetical protein
LRLPINIPVSSGQHSGKPKQLAVAPPKAKSLSN